MPSGKNEIETVAAIESKIPRWIEGLLAGRLTEIEDALRRADKKALAQAADEANALRIDGRRADPDSIEISEAPIRDHILSGPDAGAARARLAETVDRGRVVIQFFFAGAATRLGDLAAGLYFLDLWELAEKVVELAYEAAPSAVRASVDRARFEADIERIRAILAENPPAGRLPLGLGPRQVVQHRASLEAIAPGSARRVRIVVHVAATDLGDKIIADFRAREFFGFDPRNVFFLRQPYLAGWTIEGARAAPLAESIQYPYGHGHATLQLAEPGAAERGDGVRIVEDVLGSILRACRDAQILVATRRVNDLTVATTGGAFDLDRMAAAASLIERGSAVVVELVSNPEGQKGGNWVRHRGDGRKFLIEGLSAKTPAWQSFLDRHPNSPYNAFRNVYEGRALREMLLRRDLPPYLRVRPRAEDATPGLYLELVSGDLSAFAEARSEAFRNDPEECIHDFKEFRDLVAALPFAARQDRDPAVRRIYEEGGRR